MHNVNVRVGSLKADMGVWVPNLGMVNGGAGILGRGGRISR